MNWDLTSYFPAFDGPEMRAFTRQLEAEIAALLREAGQLPDLSGASAAAWEALLLRMEGMVRRESHLASYLGCLTAADASHEGYRQAQAAFAHLAAEAEKLEVELQRGLKEAADADFEAFVERPALAGCQHFLRRARREAQRTMSPPEERLAADLGVDGIHAWGRLYDTLSGKIEFEMAWPDGRQERLPMAQRRSLLAHGDRRVRRAAFEGGNRAWAQVADVTAAALNAIAGTRLSLNRHRGVDDFLDVALFQAGITRRSLDALFEAILEASDLPRRVLRLKARAMGAPGVTYYDLEAPLPLPEEEPIPWERGRDLVRAAFARHYPALAEFVGQLLERRWVEWEPRPGKRPGAFCTSSLLTMEPRVYMTYHQSRRDVRTLAHEAGHAYHAHVMRGVRPFAHQYPMTLAESASTFGEMLLTSGLLGEGLTELEEVRILDTETAEGAVYLTDIPVRYFFEKAFYEERQEGEVAVSRLQELMVQAQRQVFGDTLDEDGTDPLFWASKLHFYISQVTFYNFPYTFGYLLSRGLFARYRQEGPAFLPRYEEFLRRTGGAPAEEVARQAIGCDLESPQFWKDAIETLREPVERLEARLPAVLPA
ncbi:MAG: M3 family oligoendopeptidase [Gemmatimonadota bacterium]